MVHPVPCRHNLPLTERGQQRLRTGSKKVMQSSHGVSVGHKHTFLTRAIMQRVWDRTQNMNTVGAAATSMGACTYTVLCYTQHCI